MASGLAIAAASVAIAGTVTSYRQQEANAKAQEAALRYNARQEEAEARGAEKETLEQNRRQQEEQKALRASQRAAYGASGSALYAGSPLAVLGETAAKQKIESMDLLRSGAAEYNRHMAQRNVLNYQAQVAGNSVSKSAMRYAVAGGVLTGIGNTAPALISDAKSAVAFYNYYNS